MGLLAPQRKGKYDRLPKLPIIERLNLLLVSGRVLIQSHRKVFVMIYMYIYIYTHDYVSVNKNLGFHLGMV